jgi:hypothetical protein
MQLTNVILMAQTLNVQPTTVWLATAEEVTTNQSDERREDAMGESINSVRVSSENTGAGPTETVADIIERKLEVVIKEWLARVEKEPELTAIPLNYQERTGHLPQLLHDVIRRLRMDEGTKAPILEAAAHHGNLRSKQGYTVAMAVEESRLLQVSIFSTLHRNETHLEFSTILPAVVTIADEVDSQLKQQMLRFMAADEAKVAKAAQAAAARVA